MRRLDVRTSRSLSVQDSLQYLETTWYLRATADTSVRKSTGDKLHQSKNCTPRFDTPQPSSGIGRRLPSGIRTLSWSAVSKSRPNNEVALVAYRATVLFNPWRVRMASPAYLYPFWCKKCHVYTWICMVRWVYRPHILYSTSIFAWFSGKMFAINRKYKK